MRMHNLGANFIVENRKSKHCTEFVDAIRRLCVLGIGLYVYLHSKTTLLATDRQTNSGKFVCITKVKLCENDDDEGGGGTRATMPLAVCSLVGLFPIYDATSNRIDKNHFVENLYN